MIIDNIIVIIVAIILITYLSINYVKKHASLNLIFIAILAFSLGIYIPIIVSKFYLRIRYQCIMLLGIFVIPAIYAFIQYNNINLGEKLLYKRARKYFNSQKYTKCISTIQKIIEIDQNNSEMLFLLAMCYIELDESQEAKEKLYDVIRVDENHYEAYYRLGRILEKENDVDSAIDMYEKAIEINPSFYDTYETLGILLAGEGELEKAEIVYKAALDYHSDSYEALYNLAMIQLELKKNDDAEMNLESALSIKSDIVEAIYTLGNIKMLKGDYNEAITLFSQITKDENYGLKAYYKIAIIYVTKNEFEKAMSIVEYLVSSDKSYIDMIENEFVFNAMRSRIDAYLRGIKDEDEKKELEEYQEVEARRTSRRNWFSRDLQPAKENSSILYNDIDIERTGFRNQEENDN